MHQTPHWLSPKNGLKQWKASSTHQLPEEAKQTSKNYIYAFLFYILCWISQSPTKKKTFNIYIYITTIVKIAGKPPHPF